MTFLDFFAGVGGFRHGMERVGHKCVGFCEFDKFAVASYTSMHLITDEQRAYLKTLDLKNRQKEILKEGYRNGEWYSNDIRRVLPQDLPRADCWCFGFPCQDISVAGKQKGFKGNRSSLFFRVTGLLRQLNKEDRPKLLFIENVRNLLSINRGYDFARLLVELDEVGYDAEWEVINSKDFGVPQNRERVFIIGHLRGRGGQNILPIERKFNKATVRQLKGGSQGRRIYDTSGLSVTLSSGGGGQGAKTGLYKFVAVNYRNDIQTIYSEEDQCNVALRRLTPRECFRLQGWTDDYFEKAQFVNSDSQLYKQAGNGVTVNVIRAIAERF